MNLILELKKRNIKDKVVKLLGADLWWVEC